MYSGGGWNPKFEEPYLLNYSESEDETFTQCTVQISLWYVKFYSYDPSPILRYSENYRITKFNLIGFSSMKP